MLKIFAICGFCLTLYFTNYYNRTMKAIKINTTEKKFYQYKLFSDARSYIGMGFEKNPSNNLFFRHIHNDIEIFVLLEGNGVFAIENERYNLTNSCIIVIPAGTYHYYEKLDEGFRANAVINLEKNTLKKMGLYEIVSNLIATGPVFDTSSSPSICALLTKPLAKINALGEEKTSLYFSCIIQQFLLELGSENFSARQEKIAQSEITQQVVRYINDNLDKPLSLKYIEKGLFLSRSYISHKFLSDMRIGVMAYVKAKRIAQAKILMQNGVKPTDVFAQVGFNDYTTFFRAFKRDTGATPSEFFGRTQK